MAYRSAKSITLKNIVITAISEKAYRVAIANKKDFYQAHSFWAPKNQVLDTGLYNNYVGNITMTDWFWGKIKDSLQKTGIPVEYSENSDQTAVDKTLNTTQAVPVPVPLWQMQETKALLKRLICIFKDPAELEEALEKILVIQNNQVFLNIPVTPAGPTQPLAEEMKSEVIQEILSEFFNAEEIPF